MSETEPRPARAHGRFWLFAPYVLLALLAVAWSGAWLFIRGRATEAIDAWLAAEAAAGRHWDCPDRSVAGFPFRLEVTCPTLSLRSPDLTASVGRVAAVAQVYQPRHVIIQAQGPFRLSDPRGATVEATWRALDASIRFTQEGLQRASLVTDGPSIRATGLSPGEITLAGARAEAHLRPDPARYQTEGAFDASLRAAALKAPLMDEFLGGAEPADIGLEVTATQLRQGGGRPLPDELHRWRQAGGRLEVAQFSLLKGPRRVEARGELQLDDAHRLAGRLEAQAAGLESLVASLVGASLGRGERGSALGGVLGSIAGQIAAGAAEKRAAGPNAALKPLPPIRLEGGRIYLGPLALPNVRLVPLY